MTPEQFAATRTAPKAAVPYTPEQFAKAREVRTRYGWYDVLYTIDAHSVAVAGDFGDMRIPAGTILEVKP
jgi:hypothetical protein